MPHPMAHVMTSSAENPFKVMRDKFANRARVSHTYALYKVVVFDMRN